MIHMIYVPWRETLLGIKEKERILKDYCGLNECGREYKKKWHSPQADARWDVNLAKNQNVERRNKFTSTHGHGQQIPVDLFQSFAVSIRKLTGRWKQIINNTANGFC